MKNYLDLANALAWKVYRKYTPSPPLEELKSEAYLKVAEALYTYDDSRGRSLKSHVYAKVSHGLQDFLRDNHYTTRSKVIQTNIVGYYADVRDHPIKNEELIDCDIIKLVWDKLTYRKKYIAVLYLLHGYRNRDIAKRIGVNETRITFQRKEMESLLRQCYFGEVV